MGLGLGLELLVCLFLRTQEIIYLALEFFKLFLNPFDNLLLLPERLLPSPLTLLHLLAHLLELRLADPEFIGDFLQCR